MPSKKSPKPASPGAPSLVQLKIALVWLEPQVWRSVVVPADTTLDVLHDVIQVAMGWEFSHLHQFIHGTGRNAVCFGPQKEFAAAETCDEASATVEQLAPRTRSSFHYEYDFGDSWIHKITREKTLPPDPSFKHPICLEGARACPPEDCGGFYGYADKLDILADPKHEEYEEIAEWMGEDWNAEAFDLKKVNARLKKIRL
jgi:hypothetical protein